MEACWCGVCGGMLVWCVWRHAGVEACCCGVCGGMLLWCVWRHAGVMENAIRVVV